MAHEESNFEKRVKRVIDPEIKEVMNLFQSSTHTSFAQNEPSGSGSYIDDDIKTEEVQNGRKINIIKRKQPEKKQEPEKQSYLGHLTNTFNWLFKGAPLPPETAEMLSVWCSPWVIYDPNWENNIRVINGDELKEYIYKELDRASKAADDIDNIVATAGGFGGVVQDSDSNLPVPYNPDDNGIKDVKSEIQNIKNMIHQLQGTFPQQANASIAECCESLSASLFEIKGMIRQIECKGGNVVPENYWP